MHPVNIIPTVRVCNFLGTTSGALCLLAPLDEMTFKRLLALQKLMNFVLPHFGGLNPKGFRLLQSPESRLFNRSKNIVDGDLVWRCVCV